MLFSQHWIWKHNNTTCLILRYLYQYHNWYHCKRTFSLPETTFKNKLRRCVVMKRKFYRQVNLLSTSFLKGFLYLIVAFLFAWVIQILFMQVELLCVLVSGAEKYDIWTHIYSNAQRKVIKPATMQHRIFIEMNMTRLTWHEEKSLKFCRYFNSKHLWL